MRHMIGLLLLCVVALEVQAVEPILSKDAPPDKAVLKTTDDEIQEMIRAMEPYVRQARKTYPAAKARFLKGLPPGEHFFITTRLHDSEGRMEQVFIAVSSVDAGIVKGIIYSEVQTVVGYSFKQEYSFPESELVDWLITKPDGSEEGNFVGKFMDSR